MPLQIGAQYSLKGLWLGAIGGAVALSLGIAAVQTARIHGFDFLFVSIEGWKESSERWEKQAGAEIRAHRTTKANVRNAQVEAQQLENERLAKIEAQQKDISDAITRDYTLRLADARDRAERLRQRLQAGGQPAGAGRGIEVSGVPDAAAGTPEAAVDSGLPPFGRTPFEQLERDLIATEQAEQLNALIDWVKKQASVDPNVPAVQR